jgi:hypothetical protein
MSHIVRIQTEVRAPPCRRCGVFVTAFPKQASSDSEVAHRKLL